jgi:glycosyltransferase involved in cell wall biosynthesis
MIGGVCRKVARHFAIESEVGWIKEAEAACESLTPDDVDIILATAPPFVSFWLAKRLSEKLKRPYVLDYRDPWVVRSDSAFAAMQSTQELEKHLIEHSSAVTVVSQSLLNGRLGVNEKLHVITNGFDPEEFDHIEPFKFGHFAIVYAGSFYPPKRVITPLMQALGRLGSNDRARTVEWKFHYYGIHGDHVYKEARRFGVTDKIVIHGRVPRAEALSAVRGSNVTVVITSVIEEKAEQDRGIVTGKIFDSLGMCIPVLLIGPPEADVDHIIETAGLTRKVTAQDIHGMVSFLEEAMTGSTLKANRPDVYAWPNVIRKLDAILRNALDSQLH